MDHPVVDSTSAAETMFLTQIPGMAESILAAAEEPLGDGVTLDAVE